MKAYLPHERLAIVYWPSVCFLFQRTQMRLLIDRHRLQGILLSSILSSLKEKGCFIRPYLGCCQRQDINVKPEHQTYPQVDIPLQVSQMGNLGVSDAHIKQCACKMAEALAILRWIGEIDGNGVEYTLAPPWGETIMENTISNSLVATACGCLTSTFAKRFPWTRPFKVASHSIRSWQQKIHFG